MESVFDVKMKCVPLTIHVTEHQKRWIDAQARLSNRSRSSIASECIQSIIDATSKSNSELIN